MKGELLATCPTEEPSNWPASEDQEQRRLHSPKAAFLAWQLPTCPPAAFLLTPEPSTNEERGAHRRRLPQSGEVAGWCAGSRPEEGGRGPPRGSLLRGTGAACASLPGGASAFGSESARAAQTAPLEERGPEDIGWGLGMGGVGFYQFRRFQAVVQFRAACRTERSA